MANELNANLDPSLSGRTIVARLIAPGGILQGGDISLSEVARPTYIVLTGDVPALTPSNTYSVEFVDTTSTEELVALGCLLWDGQREILAPQPSAQVCQ